MSKSWIRGFSAAKAAREHAIAMLPSKMMGAAIFAGPNLISIGFNDYTKTHTDSIGVGFNYSTHAEHSAMLKIRHHDNNKNLVMYVYRENFLGPNKVSKPCKMCLSKMKDHGIKRVRFFNEQEEPDEIRIV